MTVQQASILLEKHKQAIQYLVHYHYWKRLYNHRCTASWTEEDLYQETITRALEHIDQFSGSEQDFLRWVKTIAKNLANTLVTKHMAAELRNQQYFSESITPAVAEEQLDSETISHALYEAIEDLTPNQAICLLYTLDEDHERGDMEGLSRQLGISYTNLRQFRHQATNRLRKRLAPYK